MASRQVLNTSALALEGGALSRTVAYSTDSRNSQLISLAVVLGCVINGDTLTGILRQATWLVVALIILIVLRAVEDRYPCAVSRQPVPLGLTRRYGDGTSSTATWGLSVGPDQASAKAC